MDSATFQDVATFDWSDYAVFVFMLVASALIGVYFGCFGNKQKSADEYLLGGKKMNVIPVGLSLVASAISGVTLVGVPAEVYTDTPTYWIINLSFIVSTFVAYYFFIPIFYELNVSIAYEYLELRFDRNIRSIASIFFSVAYLLFLPTVVYVPSLTLSQVTGINLHVISTSVTIVCVFYTMIGGLKAVVWTDFLQITVMIISCIAIICIGTIDAGGLTKVLQIAYDDGKLNVFDMEIDPFKRTTFWGVLIGGFISSSANLGFGVATVQRYLSLPKQNDVKMLLFIQLVGIIALMTISIYCGVLLYAVYYGCDPIKQKLVEQADQIFPYYMLDKIGYVPTLPGLFVAGVFSAALSTLSTGLNTVAAILYENYLKTKVSEKKSNAIMKLTTVLIGAFSIVMVFAIENMGKVLSVTYIITSVTAAPVYVLFFLGMLFPSANSKGAMASIASSTIFLGWLAIGSSVSKVNFISKDIYPVNTCPGSNDTIDEFILPTNSTTIEDDGVFIMYKLSYMLYIPSGIILGLFFGIVVSYLTGPTDAATLDPRLISPPLRRFLPKRVEETDKHLQEKLMQITA